MVFIKLIRYKIKKLYITKLKKVFINNNLYTIKFYYINIMTGLSSRDPKNGYNYYSPGILGGFGQLSTGLRFQDKGLRYYNQNKNDNFYYSFHPFMSKAEK